MSGAGEIAKWLASLSVKWAVQVRAQHDPLVSERWLSEFYEHVSTSLHQCLQSPSICYYVYVMMHVKDP